jgi:hypothetical protein
LNDCLVVDVFVGLEGSGRSRSHTPCADDVGVLGIRATSYDPTKPLLYVRLQYSRRNLAHVAIQNSADRRPFEKEGRI